MPDKYRQAIANAMRGKCIPHYDRIKAFSIEEMAEFICGLCEDQDNYLGYIEWLKSEAGTNVNNNDKSPETQTVLQRL